MKKKRIFLSFPAFIVYSLILFALLTVFLMSRLTDYLEEYEKYRPTTITNEILDDFKEHRSDKLEPLTSSDSSLKGDALNAYIEEFADPDTLFCYRSSTSSDTLVYDYISKNKKIATLTLCLTDEKSPRGFDIYSVSSLEFQTMMTYTVTAPADCTVYVNGKDLSKGSATCQTIDVDRSYEAFDEYTFSTVRYTIDYPEYITELTAHRNGSAAAVISQDTSNMPNGLDYTVTFEIPEAMKNELDSRTRDAIEAYVYYTTLHSIPVSTVLPYIHKNASLYKNIQMFDNTWSNSRSKDEFTKFDVYDFVYYEDDRAACSVSVIYRLYKYAGPRDFDFDFKVFFVKNGEEWYITSMERIVDN